MANRTTIRYYRRYGAKWSRCQLLAQAPARDDAAVARARRRAVTAIEHEGRAGYGDDQVWLALVEQDTSGTRRVVAEYFQGRWSNPLVAAGLASTPVPRLNEQPA